MIEIFLAFSAGLISFLSPCVLPLIPGYISYISGSTLNELLEKKSINLFPIVLFTLGFSIVFISFGATATFLGSLVLDNSNTLRIVAGTIIIIFSLQIIGLINLNVDKNELEKRNKKLKVKENDFGSGALWKFSQSVGSARYGAVTHPGALKEKKTYSDI